ncbi:hypothetical protein LINPERPRIM_LOCUS37379, partial [Linum perenne]
NAPEWLTFKNVPPNVITVDGISWISSLIGKPIKRFVREGLKVKVCVLRDRASPCPTVICIELDDGEMCSIEIEQGKAREYSGKQRTIWLPKVTGVQSNGISV